MGAHWEGRVGIVFVSPRGKAAIAAWTALRVIGFTIARDARLEEVVSSTANRSAIRGPGRQASRSARRADWCQLALP